MIERRLLFSLMSSFQLTLLLLSCLATECLGNYPTHRPTWKPTRDPTFEPTPRPTYQFKPTRYPTPAPSPKPSRKPTAFPTLHGGVHTSRDPTPSPTMDMESYAMEYKLFNKDVTLADMMAIAVTIWGAIFVFALKHHYSKTGQSDKLANIRLEDISAHSDISGSTHSGVEMPSSKAPPSFKPKKSNRLNLRGSSGTSSGSGVDNKSAVAAAVASALHDSSDSTQSSKSSVNLEEDEDTLRM